MGNKILIISCLVALALAAPEADADPYYGYYGHGLLAHGNTLVGPGGLSPAWPTTVGLGFQSTVYGARGKRSADPYYGYYGHGLGLAHHGGHATSYTHRSPQGLSLRHGLYYGKRSADAAAYHPYGLVLTHNNNVYSGFTGNHYATGLPGHSFAAVTHLGKRSAEPAGLFAAGYGFTNGPASVSAVGNHFASNYGVSQLHPGPASSFQQTTRLHKRAAEPFGF